MSERESERVRECVGWGIVAAVAAVVANKLPAIIAVAVANRAAVAANREAAKHSLQQQT